MRNGEGEEMYMRLLQCGWRHRLAGLGGWKETVEHCERPAHSQVLYSHCIFPQLYPIDSGNPLMQAEHRA